MEVHSIFKYTIERNGIHFIPHDNIEQFKKDPLFRDDEINEVLWHTWYQFVDVHD